MHQPITWRPLGAPDWKAGTLVDGLDRGSYAIAVEGGFVTMDRNGTTRVSPAMGAWEGRYVLASDAPVLRITPNVVTYVVELREA